MQCGKVFIKLYYVYILPIKSQSPGAGNYLVCGFSSRVQFMAPTSGDSQLPENSFPGALMSCLAFLGTHRHMQHT